ncbi:MAG: serine protease [bacterium]|nr:serine protease [bacterium]
MSKNILKILAVFIFGTAGGIFADQILSPYFFPKQTTVYVTERQEITNYIQENIALKEVIEKISKTVVGVRARTEEGKMILGSGLVVTNDGFLATLADLLPQGSKFAFYIGEKWPEYQVLKRDLKNNLALVKVEGSGLHTAGFADLEKIKLGERVFLAGFNFASSTPELMVNEGIIKFFDKDLIQTNIFESSLLNGSPLFNIEGNVVGLSFIDGRGMVSAIPVSKLRQFVGF